MNSTSWLGGHSATTTAVMVYKQRPLMWVATSEHRIKYMDIITHILIYIFTQYSLGECFNVFIQGIYETLNMYINCICL